MIFINYNTNSMILLESEKKEIRKMYGILNEEKHTATMPITLENSLTNLVPEIIQALVIMFISGGDEKGRMECGDTLSFTEGVWPLAFTITSVLNCDSSMLTMSVDASETVWGQGGDEEVITKLTSGSAENMSSLGLLLNGNPPKDFMIKMTLNQLRTNPEIPLYISTTSTTDNTPTTDDTPTTDNTPTTDDTPTTVISDVKIPENWIEGITKKGWVLMKGSHGHEGKIPNTKDAIKIVQTIVGLSGKDVDGLFGPKTEQKVIDFQKKNNLKPDGKVGKKTLAKFMELAQST